MNLIKYETIKKVLFQLNPETAHNIAGWALKIAQNCPPLFWYFTKQNYIDSPILEQNIFNMRFANPIGLAAGFDKDGDFIKAMPMLGFGFCEIGTITPKAQSGNPKPRLFRLIQEKSLQNAMGFNNKGAYHMLKQLKKNRFFCYPIGINIGKNKITPQIEALKDYEQLFKAFKNYGTYIVINISSPNTPGLRNLQNEQFIKEVITIGKNNTTKPILLKLSPDMSKEEVINLAGFAIDAGVDGIIATNTTIDYSLTPNAKDFGGISGTLLKEKSFEIFKALGKEFFGKTILISVGGVDSAQEAYKRIKAGASLVQIYTALIYEGASLIKKINQELIRLIKKDGYSNISQAIGADIKEEKE